MSNSRNIPSKNLNPRSKGLKYDSGKLRGDLLPNVAIEFFNIAIPAISNVGIISRNGGNLNYKCKVEYEIDGDYIIFKRID